MKRRSKEVGMEEDSWKSFLRFEGRSCTPDDLSGQKCLLAFLVNNNWPPSPCFS
jgi:hypothetical protein